MPLTVKEFLRLLCFTIYEDNAQHNTIQTILSNLITFTVYMHYTSSTVRLGKKIVYLKNRAMFKNLEWSKHFHV